MGLTKIWLCQNVDIKGVRSIIINVGDIHMWYKKLKTIGEKYQVPFLNFNFIDFFNIPWIWSSIPYLWVFDTIAYWLSICRNLVNSSFEEIAYSAITVLYFFKIVSGRRLFRLGRAFLLLFPYLIAESWDPNPTRVQFFFFFNESLLARQFY